MTTWPWFANGDKQFGHEGELDGKDNKMKNQNWGTPEAKLWEWEGSCGVTQAWVDGRGRADMVGIEQTMGWALGQTLPGKAKRLEQCDLAGLWQVLWGNWVWLQKELDIKKRDWMQLLLLVLSTAHLIPLWRMVRHYNTPCPLKRYLLCVISCLAVVLVSRTFLLN